MTITRTIPDVRSTRLDVSRDFYSGLLGVEVCMDERDMMVLALFHRYGSNIHGDLIDACLYAGAGAELSVGDLDWIVAIVPTAFRIHLAERSRGLTGLILLEEGLHAVDAACCARFLRNLITWSGCPELADYVRITDPSADDSDGVGPFSGNRDVEVRLHWQRQGFASVNVGNGITADDCAPALLAALRGEELESPSSPDLGAGEQ